MKNFSLAIASLAILASPHLAQAQKKALDDATIVAIFDLANTADIETSTLAQERGASEEVRAMGRNFAAAHTQVRDLGRDLARKLGVTPTPPADDAMARAHQEAMQKLRALRGPAFDKAYVAHEVAYHQQVIEAIRQTLRPAIHNDELRALVDKVVPAFEAHLAGAKRLDENLNRTP